MKDIEQQFLNELDAQLWKVADKLRSHLDGRQLQTCGVRIDFP